MVVFFFSSRRRHTRCGRDWSSDVCSSDLPLHPMQSRTNQKPVRLFFSGRIVPRLALRRGRSEEHTSELQSRPHLVCRLLLEKKKKKIKGLKHQKIYKKQKK